MTCKSQGSLGKLKSFKFFYNFSKMSAGVCEILTKTITTKTQRGVKHFF